MTNDLLALQGLCRSLRSTDGTSVAKAIDMKNQVIFTITLFAALTLPFPIAANGQETRRIPNSTLSRMNVLDRARLFERAIEITARNEGVDPLILWAIAYNETRFRPWLTSPKNAKGLMQFMPATAARFGLTNPYESSASIKAAAKYVKYLGRLFDWKLESILAAYNAGEGTVSAYLQGREIRANGKVINGSKIRTVNGVPPYKETIGYVTQGVKVYQWLTRQGKFDRKTAISHDMAAAVNSSLSVPDEAAETSVIKVYYDPRTGRRSYIGKKPEQDSQLNYGPMVVGPLLPTYITQIARSTYAGDRSSMK